MPGSALAHGDALGFDEIPTARHTLYRRVIATVSARDDICEALERLGRSIRRGTAIRVSIEWVAGEHCRIAAIYSAMAEPEELDLPGEVEVSYHPDLEDTADEWPRGTPPPRLEEEE